MDERLELCYKALMCRHNALMGVKSDVSPVHWQYGAIARLKKGETIDKYLVGGYSSISLGYIGVYEMTKLMKGVSHTDPAGEEFALRVMRYLRAKCDKWKTADRHRLCTVRHSGRKPVLPFCPHRIKNASVLLTTYR